MPTNTESTIELVERARTGDERAAETLISRSMPDLIRWAHRRLPMAARGLMDTLDLAQEAAVRAISHLDAFEPRHVGSMRGYLRTCVRNCVIDEIRRAARRPVPTDVDVSELRSHEPSPFEHARSAEQIARYRNALATLTDREQQLIRRRVERGWSAEQTALRFGFATADAARMAVNRALAKLRARLSESPRH